MKKLLLILFVLLSANAKIVFAKEIEMTIQQETRFNNLSKEIRCIVCASEPVATSSAKIAIDMRESIKTQILNGASDNEIRNYFKNHYGEFVLLNPSFDGATLLLWFAPLLIIIIGCAIFFTRFRNEKKPTITEDNTDALNALKELED